AGQIGARKALSPRPHVELLTENASAESFTLNRAFGGSAKPMTEKNQRKRQWLPEASVIPKPAPGIVADSFGIRTGKVDAAELDGSVSHACRPLELCTSANGARLVVLATAP